MKDFWRLFVFGVAVLAGIAALRRQPANGAPHLPGKSSAISARPAKIVAAPGPNRGQAERVSSRPTERSTSFDTERGIQAERLIDLTYRNPTEAARQAMEMGDDMIPAVAAAWIKSDLLAAQHWAMSLKGRQREIALSTMATELATSDLSAAVDLGFSMQSGAQQAETLAFIAAQMARTAPDLIMKWTEGIQDLELRTAVERHVLPAIACEEPLSAANYAASKLNGSALQAIVIPEIVQRWTQLDPVAAVSWVEQFQSPQLRRTSVDALVRVWMHNAPEALPIWLQQQPAGMFRNEMISAFAGTIAPEDRRIALDWTSAITDEPLRAATLAMIRAL